MYSSRWVITSLWLFGSLRPFLYSSFFVLFCFELLLFIYLFYNIVLVLLYIDMNPPRVYTCSPYWTPLPPPSPYHPSGSSQCTSPEHPVSCIEPGLAICFTYDIIHVSMPFSQIIPPLPSTTESRRLFYTSVSLAVSHTGLSLYSSSIYSCHHFLTSSASVRSLPFLLLCPCLCETFPWPLLFSWWDL